MIVKLNVDEIDLVVGGNNGVIRGVIAGLTFGLLDISLMIPLEMQNKNIAMAGRFAIGFLIPNTQLPVKPWLNGTIVGLLLSLPDAIITGVYAPILGIGILGGMIIGVINNRF